MSRLMQPFMTARLMGCARVTLLVAPLMMGGCKDLTGNSGLPAGTQNPSFFNTPTGAIGMYTSAINQVAVALSSYIRDSGLLSDELEDESTGASAGTLLSISGVPDPLDERLLPPTVIVASYSQLQAIRALANQAIGALTTYDTAVADTATSKVRRGELYAVEGYAEVMLADLFCSGVPLSTLDFQHDFTYHTGISTTQVYHDAIAKFDTALSLADTSIQVRNLARIGQGRANLDLGRYAAAADDVTTVPTAFVYDVASPLLSGSIGTDGFSYNYFNGAQLSDREGRNGLPYRSSGDPRTASTITCIPQVNGCSAFDTLFFPTKYSVANQINENSAPVSLADGIEARLIEAEAALQRRDAATWLAKLNGLRATVSGLPQLVDPVDSAARVDTLFAERAAWLYLTGHRQGDLRRLIREYGRDPNHVYPTGQYFAPGTGFYGTDVVAPIPQTEAANPLFHGCLSNAA